MHQTVPEVYAHLNTEAGYGNLLEDIDDATRMIQELRSHGIGLGVAYRR